MPPPNTTCAASWQRGADLVVYSGHKFLGGPTSGIVAGRKDLVHAASLQNRGIGRGMKVGKESIAGVMAALQAWMQRDHAAVRAREEAALRLWLEALQVQRSRGASASARPDRQSACSACVCGCCRTAAGRRAAWPTRWRQGDPPVMVRDYQTDLGHVDLDPCNLHPAKPNRRASLARSCCQACTCHSDAAALAADQRHVKFARVCLADDALVVTRIGLPTPGLCLNIFRTPQPRLICFAASCA
jgi:seryl-tRNA(Sec) selenium transferase